MLAPMNRTLNSSMNTPFQYLACDHFFPKLLPYLKFNGPFHNPRLIGRDGPPIP